MAGNHIARREAVICAEVLLLAGLWSRVEGGRPSSLVWK